MAPLFARLVARVVEPVARDAFRVAPGLREAIAKRVERQMGALAAAGVLHVLPTVDLLAWAAGALLRARAELPGPKETATNFDGYRALRARRARGTLAALIVELYLRVVPGRGEDLRDPDVVVRRVGEVVAALPAETVEPLALQDLAELEGDVTYLERWWASLAGALASGPLAALQGLVASRFFQVTHDEGALTRLALEARLVGMVFGAARVEALLERVATLERASTGVAQSLAARRAREPGPGAGAASSS